MTEADYLGGLLRHYVRTQGDEDFWARKIDLFDGEIAGFQVGDRVQYSDQTRNDLRGKTATVMGFDKSFNIWTQPDGQEGFASTSREVAALALLLLERPD